MGTLADLNELQPANTGDLAAGDDAIRETRLAIKTTFNVEHTLDGSHEMPQGNTATRPAAADGRLYINTEVGRIQYATSGQWLSVGNVVSYTFINSYVITFVNPTRVTVSITIQPANNGGGGATVTTEPPWLHGTITHYARDNWVSCLVRTFADITKLTVARIGSGSTPITGFVLVYT